MILENTNFKMQEITVVPNNRNTICYMVVVNLNDDKPPKSPTDIKLRLVPCPIVAWAVTLTKEQTKPGTSQDIEPILGFPRIGISWAIFDKEMDQWITAEGIVGNFYPNLEKYYRDMIYNDIASKTKAPEFKEENIEAE